MYSPNIISDYTFMQMKVYLSIVEYSNTRETKRINKN